MPNQILLGKNLNAYLIANNQGYKKVLHSHDPILHFSRQKMGKTKNYKISNAHNSENI